MQDAFAIVIATIAAGFLARRGWQRFAQRRSGACGSCQNCATGDSLPSKQLVTMHRFGLTQRR